MVDVAFLDYAMPFWLQLFGIVSVVAFFYYANALSKKWQVISSKQFVKNIFCTALIIRIIYVVFIYFFNHLHYGDFHESNQGDCYAYIQLALDGMRAISEGKNPILEFLDWGYALDDVGYSFYLSNIYFISGAKFTVIIPLLLKPIYSSVTCILIYKIADRHFGNYTARLTAILCMLQFNLIWWCGSMMKETEMILLCMLFINKADEVIQNGSDTLWEIIKVTLLSLAIFTFRSALAIVGIISFFASFFFSNRRTIGLNKKITYGIIFILMVGFFFGNEFKEQVVREYELLTTENYQSDNMEWRSRRLDGQGNTQEFAKYAGAAVFAPLIFTIPFPSMVYTSQDQEMQMMVNGGNFIKNVLSFFVIFSMFYFLFSRLWKNHLFPILFLVGYLIALVFSQFAQSGRFHMPIIPLEMMFAAYGVSLMNKKRRKWFSYALAVEFVACIAWNWFKLAGRGLV